MFWVIRQEDNVGAAWGAGMTSGPWLRGVHPAAWEKLQDTSHLHKKWVLKTQSHLPVLSPLMTWVSLVTGRLAQLPSAILQAALGALTHVEQKPEEGRNKTWQKWMPSVREQYKMDHKRRGTALIFNHERFFRHLMLPERRGTSADRDNLTRRY